jgi:uncharacterized membrane protein
MGILLVYDVTDDASFNNIRNWMRNIEQHASDNVNKVSCKELLLLVSMLPLPSKCSAVPAPQTTPAGSNITECAMAVSGSGWQQVRHG